MRSTMVQVMVAAILLSASSRIAVAQEDSGAPSSKCWRFAFGAWTPPLDWEKSGHFGKADELAGRVERIRDSVFAKDTTAVRNNAMIWVRGQEGWSVVLFPTWWPVGVKVDFDSVFNEGREMTGHAVALVADAGQVASRARSRAVRCPTN